MSLVRYLKGKTLAIAYQVFPVRPAVRSAAEQAHLERESRRMQLYFCHDCPSSLLVRRHCQRLGLRVVHKNVARVTSYRNELLNGGGESRVPCLRVQDGQEIHWLYSQESIQKYLTQRF